MRNDGLAWQRDFPIREEVEDYAGQERVFVIDCHEGGLGFTVRATAEWSCPGLVDGSRLAISWVVSPR